MPPEEDSPLESLQKRVYQSPQQAGVDVDAYSSDVPSHEYGWHDAPPPPPKKRMSWTARFAIGAGIFLMVAGLVAGGIIYFGARSISNDHVQIDIQTPVSIASGDTVSMVITVHNGNPTTLNNANLLVTLPEGTRAGDTSDAPLTQYTDVLGDVPAGADITRTVQIKLFGPAGATLTIPAKVEYRAEGSNALFVSDAEHSITVSTSPISVQVQTLSQSASGQPFALTVVVRSNASTPVSNLALTAQYPSGFSVRATDPSPAATNFFTVGTLEPGEQKIIKITGVLLGQNADQRTFRFIAGSANPDGTSTLGNSFAEGDATVAITHPFLNVAVSLNREAADTVIASPGQSVSGMLSWQNTLTDTLTNANVRVGLSGNALDVASIRGGTGFYRSGDMSVVFNSDTDSNLAALAPGATGAGSFGFGVKPASALVGISNPTITLTVSVAGQHASGGSSPASLSSTLTRTVKIGTTVSLSSTLSQAAGDTGPVPPRPGTETTYTVTLNAKNTLNSVGAAKVTMQIPSYVRYTGKADSGISYSEDTHTITWNIGDLGANASAKGSFQIGFTPSTSQSGTAPVLIQQQTLTGVDRFTQQQVTTTAPAATGDLPGSSRSGTVQ